VAQPAEIVRLGFERLNSNDLEGFLELADPEIELHDVPEIPGSTVYRGHDGIRRWWATVTEPMEELRFELGEVTGAGERIAVVTRAVGRGRGSGAEVDWTFTTVWGFRDELISYHHGYSDHADALRAIGPATKSR
jgi:ketosteroid isomerase-like protein